MTTSIDKVEDYVRLYGVEHFLYRYGPQLKPLNVNITYRNEKSHAGLAVRVYKNDIENDIKGYLLFKGDKIPIFEEPISVEGKPIVTFLGKNRYVCVALKNKTIAVGFDVFNEIGRILSGHLEKFRFDEQKGSDDLMKIPVVDAYEKLLFDSLRKASKGTYDNSSYESFWPEQKKFAVCLSHDVDRTKKTYQYVTHFLKHLSKGDVATAKYQLQTLLPTKKRKEPYWNFEKIMKTEDGFGLKSTFFFLNETEKPRLYSPKTWFMFSGLYNLNEPEISNIIKKLRSSGWEIGLHGSYSSYKNERLLRKEKEALQNIVGNKIYGVRQHFLNLYIPETWEMQASSGFEYDSSLGFRNEIGFRWGTCHPFYPFDAKGGEKLPILEIPLLGMDRSVLSKKNGWEDCERLVTIVEKYGGVLNLVWHQRVFNENEFRNWSKTYIKLIRLCIKRGAWITTLQGINDWYRLKTKNFELENFTCPL